MDEMMPVIPFGKYRGQPLEVLAKDTQYREWLMGQDWFRSRFPQFVQVIVNNFGQPHDTPEHNEMQARFIDDDWRLKFAALCEPSHVNPATIRSSFVECIGRMCNRYCNHHVGRRDAQSFITECSNKPLARCYSPTFETETGIDVLFVFCGINGGNRKSFAIEIKPQIGDDYPAVLRQMRANDAEYLLYRSFSASGADEETFRKIFGCSGIVAVKESVVEAQTVPTIPIMDADLLAEINSTYPPKCESIPSWASAESYHQTNFV